MSEKNASASAPRLYDLYKREIRSKLKEEFSFKNEMEIPRLEKIVLNMGVGEAAADQKKLDAAVADMTLITGQKAVKTRARKAIAGFKIREGLPIGCMVTLRGERMYEFLDRLINIAMPRIRDFRGLSSKKGFDGNGNYALGLKEQIIFPEIDYDKVDSVRGMDVIFVTSSRENKEAHALLKAFNMPFTA